MDRECRFYSEHLKSREAAMRAQSVTFASSWDGKGSLTFNRISAALAFNGSYAP